MTKLARYGQARGRWLLPRAPAAARVVASPATACRALAGIDAPRGTPFCQANHSRYHCQVIGDPVLVATGVRKSFRRRVVLEGADLLVRSGESVAIVGENGSGKSTLLSICAGVARSDAGTISTVPRVGFCPQTPGLIELLTVDEHVRLLSRGLRDPKSGYARARAVLDELDVPASRTIVRDLSGGQRQKLNLALALIDDPQLLLLDEPYQGFDLGSYVDFWAQLARWTAEGRAVVVVTHLLEDRGKVDRVLFMKRGRLA